MSRFCFFKYLSTSTSTLDAFHRLKAEKVELRKALKAELLENPLETLDRSLTPYNERLVRKAFSQMTYEEQQRVYLKVIQAGTQTAVAFVLTEFAGRSVNSKSPFLVALEAGQTDIACFCLGRCSDDLVSEALRQESSEALSFLLENKSLSFKEVTSRLPRSGFVAAHLALVVAKFPEPRFEDIEACSSVAREQVLAALKSNGDLMENYKVQALRENAKWVEVLFKVSPDRADADGNTVAHRLASKQEIKALQRLRSLGCLGVPDVLAVKNKAGQNVLHVLAHLMPPPEGLKELYYKASQALFFEADNTGNTALHHAAQVGQAMLFTDSDLKTSVVMQFRDVFETKNEDRLSVFELAMHGEHAEIVAGIQKIWPGANFKVQGQNPLIFVLEKGFRDMLDLFALKIEEIEDKQALVLAVLKGKLLQDCFAIGSVGLKVMAAMDDEATVSAVMEDVLKRNDMAMLQQIVELHFQFKWGGTPLLHRICQRQWVEGARYVIEKEVDLNSKNVSEQFALDVAVGTGNQAMVVLFAPYSNVMEAVCRNQATDLAGWAFGQYPQYRTPMAYAEAYATKNSALIRCLEPLCQTDEDEQTKLRTGSFSVVRAVPEGRFNVEGAFEIATRFGNVAGLRALVDAGHTLPESVLASAIRLRQTAVVEFYFEQAPTPNGTEATLVVETMGDDKQTYLNHCLSLAYRGNLGPLQKLVARGYDYDHTLTGLEIVMKNTGDKAVVEYFIAEFKPDATESERTEGSTALHVAARLGNVVAGRLLISTYPQFKEKHTNEGLTPLAVAVVHNQSAFVAKAVAEWGLNVHAEDRERNSVPMLALQNHHIELAKELIPSVAVNLGHRNIHGQTLLDAAAVATTLDGHPDVTVLTLLLTSYLEKFSLQQIDAAFKTAEATSGDFAEAKKALSDAKERLRTISSLTRSQSGSRLSPVVVASS